MIQRGLKPAPADRHLDMAVVAHTLERVLGQRRRAVLAISSGVAIAGVVAAYSLARSSPPKVCRGAEAALGGLWDAGRKKAISNAFRLTHVPYADAVWHTVEQRLDAYTDAWITMHTDACEATHVRGEQSGELLDLRMDCLRERLDELQALTDLFATSTDTKVVEHAVGMAAALPDLGECADRTALTAPIRPPRDPAVRMKIEALERKLTTVRLLGKSGKFTDALPLARAAAADARVLGHSPTLALALFELAPRRSIRARRRPQNQRCAKRCARPKPLDSTGSRPMPDRDCRGGR